MQPLLNTPALPSSTADIQREPRPHSSPAPYLQSTLQQDDVTGPAISPPPFATPTTYAFASNYGGMAQGPFLMNTPRGGGGAGGLSLAAPRWYSPSHSTHAHPQQPRTRTLSRGPLQSGAQGQSSGRTEEDSFFGGSASLTDPPQPRSTSLPPYGEPSLSSASPIITKTRRRSSTTAAAESTVSASATAPFVGGVTTARMEDSLTNGAVTGFSVMGPSTHSSGVLRGTGATAAAGYGTPSFYHHRSATGTSLGSTGTSLSKLHLSRKDEHLDAMNMVVATSRELRPRNRIANYSVSTVDGSLSEHPSGQSGVFVTTSNHNNQSNSFYQPLQELEPSRSYSLGSLGMDAFDAQPLTYHGDSRYSFGSGHGAVGCAATYSASAMGSQIGSSRLSEQGAVAVAAEEDDPCDDGTRDGEISDVHSADASTLDAAEEREDADGALGSAVYSSTRSHGTYSFAEGHTPYGSPLSPRTPRHVSDEMRGAAVTRPVVTPPSGERQHAFVRRRVAAHTVAKQRESHTRSPARMRPIANSCPARVFEAVLDRTEEDSLTLNATVPSRRTAAAFTLQSFSNREMSPVAFVPLNMEHIPPPPAGKVATSRGERRVSL